MYCSSLLHCLKRFFFILIPAFLSFPGADRIKDYVCTLYKQRYLDIWFKSYKYSPSKRELFEAAKIHECTLGSSQEQKLQKNGE